MAIVESAYKLSEFFDKQAIREKEKKKERMFRILPTYLEQSLSGIKDEQSLYNAIPKLSAELYGYGQEIGQQGTQILSNLASSKLNELKKIQQGQQIQAIEGVVGDTKIGVGGKEMSISEFLAGKNYDPQTKGAVMETLMQNNTLKTTGQVTATKKGIEFHQYRVTPKGDIVSQTKFGVNEKTQTMDDLATEEVESLPYSPEVSKFVTEQYERDKQNEELARRQRENIVFSSNLQLAKEREAFERKIKGLQFYDTSSNERVYAKLDTDDTISYYKKDKEGKEIPFTNAGNIEQVGQQQKSPEIVAAELDQVRQMSYQKLRDEIRPKLKKVLDLSDKDFQKKFMEDTGNGFVPSSTAFNDYFGGLKNLIAEQNPEYAEKIWNNQLTESDLAAMSKNTVQLTQKPVRDLLLLWQEYKDDIGTQKIMQETYRGRMKKESLGNQPAELDYKTLFGN